MMRIHSRQYRIYGFSAVFSASSCNHTETHMSSHMVGVGPGGGGCHLNGMAVVGAATVVVAAAANRSKCMHL